MNCFSCVIRWTDPVDSPWPFENAALNLTSAVPCDQVRAAYEYDKYAFFTQMLLKVVDGMQKPRQVDHVLDEVMAFEFSVKKA